MGPGVLQPGQLVVLESTTYPGTTREQVAPILDIDIWEVIDAASTKPFGLMPFEPGRGMDAWSASSAPQ